MTDFVTKLKKMKTDLEASTSETQPQSKNEIIEQLHGIKKPDLCEIQNPDVLRYKGCGRDKRLMSSKEKAVKAAAKRINKCGKCGEREAGHNSRSCDRKKAEAKAKAEAKEREKAEAEARKIAEEQMQSGN